jgi:crossover junction endodeoxyribonuclease RusA
MLPFEFIVDGPPVSQQARRAEKIVAWKVNVKSKAQERWPKDTPPVDQDVSIEITHFFEGAPADVDNIAKPILDAIKGLVYVDDRQVSDLVCRRRPLRGPYRAEPVSTTLAEGLTGNREFLHIRIIAAPEDGQLKFL